MKTQKSDEQVNTLRYRNSKLIKKKTAGIGSISVDTQTFWYRIGPKKVVSSHPYSTHCIHLKACGMEFAGNTFATKSTHF